jgi:hypothetical protein
MKTKMLMLGGLSLLLTVTEAHPTVDRDNLKGLRGVEVAVKISETAATLLQKDGVGESQLQTPVEIKLHQAGIRVATREEGDKTPGRPYLYLSINSTKTQGDPPFASVAIALELQEEVLLQRGENLVLWPISTVTYFYAANLCSFS